MNERIRTHRFLLAVGLAAFVACTSDEAAVPGSTSTHPPGRIRAAGQDLGIDSHSSAQPTATKATATTKPTTVTTTARQPPVCPEPEAPACTRGQLEEAWAEAVATREQMVLMAAQAEESARKVRIAMRKARAGARAAAQAETEAARMDQELQLALALVSELELENRELKKERDIKRRENMNLQERLRLIRSKELE